MTGPEHYREAERLIWDLEGGLMDPTLHAALPLAQVHATLALTAATAITEGSRSREDRKAWVEACAGPRPPRGPAV
jgi:hypothetical protein